MVRRPLAVILVLALGALLPASAVAEPEAGSEARPDPHGEAAYAKHVEALRARLPEEGKAFTIVVQKPFVVIGDEAPAKVRARARRTVKWAVDLLKKDYFTKDPFHILDVFLFKDAESYEKHAKLLFDDEPSTPFGYFSHVDRALVMNIATGGGTLVHEIVHAFMAPNFPACPSWFNEGMGSLYEQCGEKDGHIHGYTNWRLPILKEAIEEGAVPTFKELCSTSDRAFYTSGRKANYAQARYLCYYLQEKGLLRAFYKAFHAGHEKDPTGYATLVKTLGEEDMEAFQKRWEAWVRTLSFP